MEDRRKRRNKFKTATHVLASPGDILDSSFGSIDGPPVSAILAGDCNVQDYTELDPLFSQPHPFRDAFIAARPTQEPPFNAYPTYNMTITLRSGPYKPGNPKRLDYIFVRGVNVAEGSNKAGFIRDQPVCSLDVATDKEGKEGKLWASDHLGIWVTLTLTEGD
jgi:hypothetical protein